MKKIKDGKISAFFATRFINEFFSSLFDLQSCKYLLSISLFLLKVKLFSAEKTLNTLAKYYPGVL